MMVSQGVQTEGSVFDTDPHTMKAEIKSETPDSKTPSEAERGEPEKPRHSMDASVRARNDHNLKFVDIKTLLEAEESEAGTYKNDKKDVMKLTEELLESILGNFYNLSLVILS